MRTIATVLCVVVVSALWLGVVGCQSGGQGDGKTSQPASGNIDDSIAVPPPKIEEPPTEPAETPATPASKEPEPVVAPATSETTKPSVEPAAEPKEKPVQGNPTVEMKTSMGSITIELYPDKAPITVANFLRYVDEKFYDGTIFHRVIGNFMIQGGGFLPGLKQKDTHDQIKNEAANGLRNDRGTIAMARTSVVDSATAQFFINVVDNAMLNHKNATASGFGYCVFGKVTAGMDVVDKIKAVATRNVGPFGDVPIKDVVIESVRRVEAK